MNKEEARQYIPGGVNSPVRALRAVGESPLFVDHAKGVTFTDIDGNVIKPATVRAVELYDLNGRRLVTAGKGVMIVRKYMSDGTIRVEKVVKK